MLRITRVRHALVITGIASLVLAGTVSAGAASTNGKYNAADASAVPSSFKGVTLQVATDATYPPDESMSGTKMVGFDVDLFKAVGVTLGLKTNENNVTFDNIIGGIQSGRYAIGNSSFTDTKAREKQVNFVDYFQAGEGVYANSSSTVKFTGLKSFCGLKVAVETGTTEQSDADATAKTCPSGKKLSVLNYPLRPKPTSPSRRVTRTWALWTARLPATSRRCQRVRSKLLAAPLKLRRTASRHQRRPRASSWRWPLRRRSRP
jgi:ABC-type amino acid transport substrate-binding protein